MSRRPDSPRSRSSEKGHARGRSRPLRDQRAEPSPLDSLRLDRVGQEIHQVLARALREEVKDPRIADLSITAVRMSRDLRLAHVNLVPLGGKGDPAVLLAGLNAASGFLRRTLGAELRLFHTPELHFHFDEGLDESLRMSRLLTELEQSRAGGGAAAAEADEVAVDTTGEE